MLLAAALLGSSQARAQWSAGGIALCTADNSQYQPLMVGDGQGGAVFAWLDQRISPGNTSVAVVRMTSAGMLAEGWPADGLVVPSFGILKWDLSMLPDGTGGAYLAWTDRWYGSSVTMKNIFVFRYLGTGLPAPNWPRVGLTACRADSNQQKPQLAPDGTGGVFVVWEDHRSGINDDIYANRINGDGAYAAGWPEDGFPLCTALGDQTAPSIVADGVGGALLAWRDTRSGTAAIYALRITPEGAGAPGWPAEGAPVCTAPGDRGPPVMIADSAGGAYLAWQDSRAADADIYVHRISASGAPAPGWPADGLPVSTATGTQAVPVLASDGAGGVFVAWEDRRGADANLYVQRVDGGGVVLSGWPANGAPLCVAPGDQAAPSLAPDGAGGVCAAWTDARDVAASGLDIYAQRLTGAGTPSTGWQDGGLQVCGASGDQQDPRIATDSFGGAFAVWSDPRLGGALARDIFGLRLPLDSPIVAQVSQLSAVHRSGQTFLTWSKPPGLGWIFRVYASTQPIAQGADLEGATLLGAVQDSSWCDRRLSVITGSTYAYAADSGGPSLTPAQGLFVVTPEVSRDAYYAVTAQRDVYQEDRSIVPAANALLNPIEEFPETPRPVYQRTIPSPYWPYNPTEIYTLWVSDRDTPFFPSMCNRAGVAFDLGVVRGPGPGQPLLVVFHARGGNMLKSANGSGQADEWRLLVDDPLWTPDMHSWWFGYHEAYDITETAFQTPPAGGMVRDYTMRRLIHSLVWCRRNFPLDTARVYLSGSSMGAIGTALLSFERPDLVAAAHVPMGVFDFSFDADPNPLTWLNSPDGPLRQITDRLWGTLSANLPTNSGLRIFQRSDLAYRCRLLERSGLPPLVGFHGKNDYVVGWAEKVNFYDAVRRHRLGGRFFWDQREHGDPSMQAWAPMQGVRHYLWRYRTDTSFPALSGCSTDGDPGDGNAASGDSIGHINGFVDWSLSPADGPDHWEVILYLSDLSTEWGPVVAPESLTVDVTPRRLQKLVVSRGDALRYEVLRLPDSVEVQGGTVVADTFALVTVPGLKVYRGGSLLRLTRLGPTSLEQGPGGPGVRGIVLSLGGNPVTRPEVLLATWPLDGEAWLDLVDVSGRWVRTLQRGPVEAGLQRHTLEPGTLPSGVYFLLARQGSWKASRRVVVLR